MRQTIIKSLTIPTVLKAISETKDDDKIIMYDSMLMCMIISPILLIGSIAILLLGIIIFQWDLIMTLVDSMVLLVIGVCYEILLRVDLKLKTKLIAHIAAILFAVFFNYVVIRFYDSIGPSIWILGVIPIVLSIVQSTRILWAYTGVSLLTSWLYITFTTIKNYELNINFYILVFLFFGILFVVSLVVYTINRTRLQTIKSQLIEVSRQIDERKKTEEKNKRLALYDQLTGLPNRTLFQDLLSSAMGQWKSHGMEIYVLFLDLDMFKLINDTMGHMHGDELIKKVGERLSDTVAKGAVIARIGGDEFLILLSNLASQNDVIRTANQILQNISKPFVIMQREIYITCSIGIAKFPTDGQDMQTIIKSADLAMYKAKEEGKNRFTFYTKDLDQFLQQEFEMIIAMKNATINEEFELYYQPQFNGVTKEVIGFEALLRWNHPTLGLLYPADFIPIAEKTGLIIPIGEWVIKTACYQNKAWQNEGIAHVPISVNLSVNQICNSSLYEPISAILKETGLDPNYLQLEITERIIFKDIIRIKNELEQLKQLGVKIAIDDFGTGDSSIYYLKELPIDCIKIPMNFIHGINENIKDESIISVILALAEILKINVIAEGVETQTQLDFLNNRQCNNIQGYYFCKPKKANEVESFCNCLI